MDDTTGIDLHDRATFLGSSTDRKPKSAALKIYETETGHKVNTERAVYIGNSVSDLLFSKNTGMTPVLVDYGNTAEDISESPQGKALIDDSIIINDFATLKNEIELLRPNYKRQISFTVDKSLTSGERSIDRASITLNPTEETVYRVTHDACNEVMSHVPEIWKRFQDRFSGSQDRFSLTSLPSYRHLISEASGAIILPHIDSIGDKQIQEYYTRNRIRQEGPHTLNRGPLYYRQYIDELKGDSLKQLAIIKDEINVALEAISNPSAQTNADHIALLGIEDNLRGNMLAAYLSAINVLRESPDHSNIQEVLVLAKNLQSAYSDAVQIQYSHMLGIKHDRQATIETLKTKVGFIDDYSRLCTEASINPKVKNPEIDNPLLIAARANYLCEQYPDTTKLVGLTSGGVELAEVARLFYSEAHNRSISTTHYPISVHNGQTMWSKDKELSDHQSKVDELVGIEHLQNEHVVICEDNSNSGQTLERIVERIKSYGASSVHFAVTEIDPTRIILHHVQQKAGAKHNIGQALDRVRPIANYFHPDFIGTVGVVRILPQDNSFTKIIALDTANKYTHD